MVDPGPAMDGWWKSRGYASSDRRATVLKVALVVQAALDIALILLWRSLVLVGDSGVRLSTEQISILRTVLAEFGPISVAVGLAVTAAIFAWLSRVVENVPPLTGRTPRSSPREAIGWWLVPVASWVMPYLIIRDVAWRLRTTPDDTGVRLILPWWLLRVSAGASGLAVGRVLPLDGETARLATQAVLLVEALADLLMIAIVASIARSERAHAERLDFDSGVGQVWPRFAAPTSEERPADGLASGFVQPGNDLFRTRGAAIRPDDPLARAPDEPADEYQDRLLAALEAEATR